MTTSEATIAVRVKPGSSRTRVGGAYPGPFGDAVIVAVSARAVDGAATNAAIDAVARAIGVKSRHIRVASGLTSRDKLFTIADPPADLTSRIAGLLADA